MANTVAMLAAFTLGSVALAQQAYASSAGRCGGPGGHNRVELTCPRGQYIVGLSARGGALVDQVSIACQAIPVDGQPGTRGSFRSAGPGGGSQTRGGFCPNNGTAMLTIRTNAAAVLDRIHDALCYPRQGNGWQERRVNGTGISVGAGGKGGLSCSLQCPTGEALYKITVRSGAVVDSIEGECRK